MTDRFDLQDKVMIVTGATAGLGRDIARVLHGNGAAVVIVGRTRAHGEALAAELGERSLYIAADITSDTDQERIIADTLARFGRIDALVNNACDYADAGRGATREDWHRSLDINLISGALLSERAAPHLGAAGGGAIINLSSVSGRYGRLGALLYPAAKAAIVAVTKAQAVALAGQGTRVIAIIPAWTWSPSVAGAAGTLEHADATGARFHPLGRIGRGEEVGRAVAFAASASASFITGTEIFVDGGYTAMGPDQGRHPRDWLADR
jgi:NAD(P)-dependent dehydrogenase (short-subunit alcohol dehydrogenase family)